jgi:hypothetical protein
MVTSRKERRQVQKWKHILRVFIGGPDGAELRHYDNHDHSYEETIVDVALGFSKDKVNIDEDP